MRHGPDSRAKKRVVGEGHERRDTAVGLHETSEWQGWAGRAAAVGRRRKGVVPAASREQEGEEEGRKFAVADAVQSGLGRY